MPKSVPHACWHNPPTSRWQGCIQETNISICSNVWVLWTITQFCVGWLFQESGAITMLKLGCWWGIFVTRLLRAAPLTPMPGKWGLSTPLPWGPVPIGDLSAMLLQSTRWPSWARDGLNTPGSHISLVKEEEEVPRKGKTGVAPLPPNASHRSLRWDS